MCRFCGNPTVGESERVCERDECQQAEQEACDQQHPCGHYCGGYRGESHCLPCLQSTCVHSWPFLPTERRPKQQADDLCPLCGVGVVLASFLSLMCSPLTISLSPPFPG